MSEEELVGLCQGGYEEFGFLSQDCVVKESIKGKDKVYHTPLRQHRWVLISLSKTLSLMSVTCGQCDAGYLPSHKASPPICWYLIILLGDRGTCVNNMPRVVRPGFEPATC